MSAEDPEFREVTRPDGTEDVLINRAGVEALLQQKINELLAGGWPFDQVAQWVAQKRAWLGLDR